MPISATVAQLINAASRTANTLASGETATASEMQDCLLLLNEVMEHYTIQGLFAFINERLEFNLNSNQQMYTIGTGGDFNVSRPFKIISASILSNLIETPITILNTPQEWQQVSATDNYTYAGIIGIPAYAFISGTTPLNTIYLYPTPIGLPAKIILYIQSPLSNFNSITNLISFPEGYYETLKYSLAEKICIENGQPVSQDIKRQKQEAINTLISFNAPAPVLQSPLIGGVSGRNAWWLL